MTHLMTSLLPPLHEGHAPIYLHQAFHHAIEAYEDWESGQAEPSVIINGKPTRISVIFRRLWNCNDIIPNHTLDAMRDVVPYTYVGANEWSTIERFSHGSRIMRFVLQTRRAPHLPLVIYL
ncbi:hypothetical protein ACI0FM_06100 [Paenochrobactrum sp. BZR 588]|uniref:hypothetical protein n=1 Tax=unclassified Paenochrobactrum TaxID=2639760 RepID=UPI0038554F45